MNPSSKTGGTLVVTSFPPNTGGGSAWIIEQLMRGLDRNQFSWWACNDADTRGTDPAVGHFQSGHLPTRLQSRRRMPGIKTFLLKHFWVPYAVTSLKAYIQERKPERLWFIPHIWAIPVMHQVAKNLDLPWHISIHDFPHPLLCEQPLIPTFRRMVEELYLNAATRDVISPEMDQELEKATGMKADAIIRCSVEPEEMSYIRSKKYEAPQNVIRIGYPGTILAEDSFSHFLQAVHKINNQLPKKIELHLFTGHNYRDRDWYDPTLIVERGYLNDKDLEQAFNACDWGLALMPLTDSNPQYSHYSFPCKFTRSLASGLPIVSLGHEQSALIRLAKNYRLGVVAATSNADTLAEILLKEFTMQLETEALRSEILRCAETEFNAQANRMSFHRLMRLS